MKIAEYVSIGHPDKIADYISQYILDRYIEKDPDVKYAVEVQIKNFNVSLGGEVSSKYKFSSYQLVQFVREAVNEIGYTREYMDKWGSENAICGDLLNVVVWINQQSPDIAQGLTGWGDQGIFFGYSNTNKETFGMPFEHTLAKRICKDLFDKKIGGLDIKSQVVTDGGIVKKIIVAIPLLQSKDTAIVEEYLRSVLKYDCDVIINGTGRYVQHSTIADCGTTGRKLAVDFYGGACRLGGGSPWTKDGSKADLSLNLYARKIAKEFAEKYDCEIYSSLACCIGKKEVDISITDSKNNLLFRGEESVDPMRLKREFYLDTPIYTSMCKWGLFGEFQQDKGWE